MGKQSCLLWNHNHEGWGEHAPADREQGEGDSQDQPGDCQGCSHLESEKSPDREQHQGIKACDSLLSEICRQGGNFKVRFGPIIVCSGLDKYGDKKKCPRKQVIAFSYETISNSNPLWVF